MSVARRSLQIVAFMCTLIVGVTSMALIVTQTTWFKEWLRGFIVRQAEDYVNGRLSIGRLDGNLFFGVELEDVDVTQNGKTVVGIKDLTVDYSVFSVLGGDVVLDDIRLNQPVIHVVRTAEGWNLTQLIKARTPDPDEPKSRRTLEIGEIGITDGTLHFEGDVVGTTGVDAPERVEKFDASIGIRTNEDELTVDVNHASLRASKPQFGVNQVTGVIRRTSNEVTIDNLAIRTEESALDVNGVIRNIEGGAPEVDLSVTSEKLAVGEIAKLIPAARGYERLQPAFDLTARGPADRIAVDVNAREANIGRITADLVVDADGTDRRVAGTANVSNLNVGALVPQRAGAAPSTLKSDITGQATFDLALPSEKLPLSGTFKVNAGHVQVAGYEARNVVANGRVDGQVIRVNANAAAYGGQATVAGTVRTGGELALDLSGRAANVDLRNLPKALNIPGAPSRLQLAYNVKGRGSVFTGDVRFQDSTLAGGRILAGTTASFNVGAGAPRYAAKGQVENLDLQQVGQAFNVTALATDRYASRINASFDVKGSGGGERYPLAIDATGTVTDSELFGASFPRLDFTANLANGDIKVDTVGQFAGLDPAVVSGNERVKGSVSGAVDVDATIRDYASGVTPESIDVAGRINLGESMINGLQIDTAAIDGSYADRTGQLTQLSIAGPDVNVTGQGSIALNDTGNSNLTLHVESASLDRIGTIIGQPLKGAAVVDATVTGNARELQATGTLKGSNIGHGENEALSLATDFAVKVPDLAPGQATVQAKSTATFLEVGGQKITELTADTTYAMSQVDFNATAKEGVRELSAQGRALLHTDHQEVHLQGFALQSEMIRWASAPGTETTVRYGNNRVEVDNLRLVNGDQRIEADGVIGAPDGALQVKAENVDVAQLDQLALGEQRLAGRLNANATITGEMSAPRAEGDFALTQGAFRTFKFESFAGKVDYAGRGMNVDVRLQQNPQAWLTAKGYAPLTLLRPTPEGVTGHAAPGPGEAIALEVASSQIDLGLIQGFTSYVTNVTGVLQANVKVTGSGYDPHLNGAIDVRGGAFAVPELGTAYSGLDTRVDLDDEGLKISEFKVLDDRGFPMTIGGALALHNRSVGAVDVSIKSENFEFIDNELADIKLDTDIHITGEVRRPRVEGFVEVENGTVDVARILELTTADAYATEATVVNPEQPAPLGPAPTLPAQPSIFQALDLELGVGVPSNLVLRGDDLRPANAPIDIGSMNVTVGGALQLRKAPGETMPRIVGEVNTVRGNYTFQGRRFNILRDGRIRFGGTEEIDPAIDLRASRDISGVEAIVRVQGTLRQPELSFSSNPPLEQADILSLIIFNAPVNELGEGQQVSLAERAGALAGGYLASGLARSIGSALELDEFEISAQGENGAGPSLTIGEQVGERFFFRVRQGFGEAQATELILEYQIAEFLRLQASGAQISGGTQRVQFRRIERGGLDLIFFFSY
jgi:autotransporter translocation and assembly factor TamB